MPKPIYILRSESGSEEKTTGLGRHFNVLEQFELNSSPEPTDSDGC
jgi:hypothetical protein